MKQILIEKYIEPSEIKIFADDGFAERWFDRCDNLHSFMGQPSEVWYKNGQIKYQFWHKKCDIHRDRDLPAYIEYNSNGRIIYQSWYKKGVKHRDGDLPAIIYYNLKELVWCKNGKFIKREYF